MKTKKCGSSSVETLVSFCLLSLFIGFIFLLTFHTSQAYQKLSQENIALSQMRIASSYLRTTLRQNKVLIAEHHALEGPALVIEEKVFGEIFETWIYLEDGLLKEATLPQDQCITHGEGLLIAKLDSMHIHLISPKHLQVTLNNKEDDSRVLDFHTLYPIQRIERYNH